MVVTRTSVGRRPRWWSLASNACLSLEIVLYCLSEIENQSTDWFSKVNRQFIHHDSAIGQATAYYPISFLYRTAEISDLECLRTIHTSKENCVPRMPFLVHNWLFSNRWMNLVWDLTTFRRKCHWCREIEWDGAAMAEPSLPIWESQPAAKSPSIPPALAALATITFSDRFEWPEIVRNRPNCFAFISRQHCRFTLERRLVAPSPNKTKLKDIIFN
jgi:hypothetical protein